MKIKIDKADQQFSLYVRTRDKWTCQRCGRIHEEGSQGLHCSHFWGRGKENTRFDEVNADAICFGCHNFFHAHPAEHTKWKKKQLGDLEYDLLEKRADTMGKKDRKLMYLVYKQKNETFDS